MTDTAAHPLVETQRTDALCAKHKSGVGNTFYGEMEQLARTLERELVEQAGTIERLTRERDQAETAHKLVRAWLDNAERVNDEREAENEALTAQVAALEGAYREATKCSCFLDWDAEATEQICHRCSVLGERWGKPIDAALSDAERRSYTMKVTLVGHRNTPPEPKVNMSVTELENRVFELRRALEHYGQHRPGCGEGCTCGYIDAL